MVFRSLKRCIMIIFEIIIIPFFFERIFSVKNQTENDKAVSCNAITVVGLERQVLVGRIKSGFALFFG